MYLGTNQDHSVMLSINYGATGSYDCDYIAKGDTEEELIRDLDLYVRGVHDSGPGGLPPQIQKNLRSLNYTV